MNKLIHHLILDDRRLTVQQIAKSIGISSGLVHTILSEMLGMSCHQDGSQEG